MQQFIRVVVAGQLAYNEFFRCTGELMKQAQEIFALARERMQVGQLPYAGAVTAQDAYALLQMDSHIILIDVRTQAERDWVGKVVINEAQHGAVEWSSYPGGAPNPHFLAQLQQLAQPDQVILFLCRSGVRSRHAAKLATEHGFSQCYDILQGFEGDKDGAGHRKMVGGWCHAGLPWIGA